MPFDTVEHRENAKICHLMRKPLVRDLVCHQIQNFFRGLLGNASLFTKILFTIFVPINPPRPNQQNEAFPLEFRLEGSQTELRTLSQNCEQTLQKLRTNRIMNKLAFLNWGCGCVWVVLETPPPWRTNFTKSIQW